MTHSYRAYGLRIKSDRPVSALQEKPAHFERPDVSISLSEMPEWVRNAMRLPFQQERPRTGKASGDDSPFTLTSFGDREFFQLAYGQDARFAVDRAATRIWGTCLPPLTSEDLATYLLGPIMGFALRCRGVTALHASSVCLSNNAVVLCGPSESGKSTTAAALALRGVPVLAEDISAIAEAEGLLYTESGYPRVCLWPHAVKILFGAPGALPRLTPTWEKCYLPLDGVAGEFASQKQRLGLVYIFAPRANEADAPRIVQLGPRDALLELVQNTYMNWLLDPDQRAAELDVLTKLVAEVPVRRIVPHTDPERIEALCDLIIRDTNRLFGRRSFAAAGSRR